jgi:hypothetical protein
MSPKHAVCHPPRGRQTLMKACRSLVGYMPLVGFSENPYRCSGARVSLVGYMRRIFVLEKHVDVINVVLKVIARPGPKHGRHLGHRCPCACNGGPARS